MRTLNTTTLDNMESFIIDYQKRKGKSPSFREVMKALNMSSLNLVRTYILALENSGRIERTRLGNIDMLPKLKPSGVAITPIVGSIACGQPVDAVEQIEESVTLPRAIFGGGDLFILHTHGDSMIDIGIKHGDLVVIRKQNTAENGDIIVAMMNGETTLKRFYKRNGKVVLHPENKEMKDIKKIVWFFLRCIRKQHSKNCRIKSNCFLIYRKKIMCHYEKHRDNYIFT